MVSEIEYTSHLLRSFCRPRTGQAKRIGRGGKPCRKDPCDTAQSVSQAITGRSIKDSDPSVCRTVSNACGIVCTNKNPHGGICAKEGMVRIIDITPQSDRQRQKIRFAGYCRVSTKSEDQEHSLAAQILYFTNYAKEHPEYELVDVYADEGITGTDMEKRDDLNRLLRDCRMGKIDRIICKSISRFARNTEDCLHYTRLLKQYGVDVYFEEQKIHSTQPGAEFYITIYGSIAQSESENISANVKWGKAQSAKQGKVAFQYKHFLGYKKGEDGKSVIDVEQADIVKFIYDRYLAGDSLKEITKMLMDLKISTPLGKQRWSCSTVRSILTNEKYKGDAIINKTFVVDCISKRVKVNNGERKKYYVENNHPAIVDAATFAKVQEEIARRSGKKKIKQVGTKTELGKYCGKYALTERLLCGECKTPYRRCTWTVKGKKKIVWRCINRLDYGKKYCHNSPTIEENVLHDAIMAAIQQTAQQNMDALQALKTHIGVALGAAEKEGNTVEIELRIAQIDAEFKAMIDTASADTVDGFDENRIQQLIGEKNELQAKLGEITEERGRQQTVQDRLETIYAVLDGLKNHPMTYDDEEVRQLIDCVVVESKDRIKVVFCGGLQVEQPLRQEDMDFLSEMGQIPVNI